MVCNYQPLIEATVIIDGIPHRICNNRFHDSPEVGDYVLVTHDHGTSIYDGYTLVYRIEKATATGFNQYRVCYTDCDGFSTQAEHGSYTLLKPIKEANNHA